MKNKIEKYRNQKFIHFTETETIDDKVNKLTPYIEARFKVTNKREKMPMRSYGYCGVFLTLNPSQNSHIRITIGSYSLSGKLLSAIKVTSSQNGYFYKTYKETPKLRINIERAINDINNEIKKENEHQRKLGIFTQKRKFNLMGICGEVQKELKIVSTKDHNKDDTFTGADGCFVTIAGRSATYNIDHEIRSQRGPLDFDKLGANVFNVETGTDKNAYWGNNRKAYNFDEPETMGNFIRDVKIHLKLAKNLNGLTRREPEDQLKHFLNKLGQPNQKP